MKFLTILITFLLFQHCNADCVEPTQLPNGTSFGCLSEEGQYQFFCNEGYALVGPPTRLCVNGEWTGTEPRCEISLGGVESFADLRFDIEYGIIPSFYLQGSFYQACWQPVALENASILCRQVGSSGALATHKVDLDFGLAVKGPYIYATNLSCTGNESHIAQCNADGVGLKSYCSDGVLGVSCAPYIRVRHNTVLDRMQLFYERWMDLCEDSMDPQTADSYCRLEGKLGGTVVSSVDGSAVGNSTISRVECSDQMRNFADCVITVVSSTECRYLKIECLDTNIENSLRLTEAEDLHTGKLQIYREGSWGDVCHEAFYINEANAACKQLGFQGYLASPRGVYGDREGDSFKVERVKCPLGADNFSSCEFLEERRCDSPQDTVAIWCLNNKDCCLPVFNGTTLRINSTKTGQFTHGEVVRFNCRGSTIISGNSNIQCESGKWTGEIPTCVTAVEHSVRLIDGPVSDEGSIQVFLNGKWNFVCDRVFTLQTATKLCENLGTSGALEVTKFNFYNSNPEQPFSSLECNNGICESINCGTNEIAGVKCGDLQFEVRLVGPGHSRTAGRVQVFYDGIWSDLCSDYGSFFSRNGQTICAQLSYAYHSEFNYDEGQLKFGLADSNVTISFLCYGDNDHVSACTNSINICSKRGYYLACSPPDNGTLRLVEGPTSSQGIVEIYKDFSWQSICTEGWDMSDGHVVCVQLGWAGVTSTNSSFGRAVSKIGFAITEVGCQGNESSLVECSSETNTTACNRGDPATIICETPAQYQVRLTQTIEYEKNTSGLVEVYVGNEWLGVCDDDWGLPDATVVCRYLGYDFTIEAIKSYYLIATDKGWNYVNCVGNETNLGECGYSNTTVASYFFASCYRTEGAGVTCGIYVDYDVRIRPDTLAISNTISGLVEFTIGGVWFPICYNGNDLSPYFCSQLVYGNATGDVTTRELTDSESINDFNCSDTNVPLSECRPTPDSATSCASSQAVEINCVNLEGRVRLVDGNASAGHVQVFFSNRWGEVCDDLWGIEDANVVCRQLGMRAALRADSYSAYGSRDYYYWLDNVKCVGTESRLVDCPSNGWGQHNCGRYEIAGVQCLPSDCDPLPTASNTLVSQNVTHGGYATFSCVGGYKLEGLKTLRCLWSVWSGEIPICVAASEGDVQLVDGPTSYEGHLQIFSNAQWGYVCDDNWGNSEGIVVCRQLGFAPNLRGISTSTFYPISTNVSTVVLESIECVGNEYQLSECQGNISVATLCSLQELAGVECYADEGSLRLYKGTEEFSGLLQIYENGTWYYFCNFEFIGGIAPACSQLGFQTTGVVAPETVDTEYFKAAFCLYTDGYLYPSCQLKDAPNCFQNFAVNLTCTRNDRCMSRLSGNTYMGIVEFWREGRWGAICKNGFTFREAEVVCRQLGWNEGVASVGYDVTTAGAIPFHFQSVTCDASETDICNCTMDVSVDSSCIRDEAVYIECIVPADGSLRLVGGSTDDSGTLEIFHDGYWGSVCDDAWSGIASSVACKQLGYSGYNSFSIRVSTSTDVWLDDIKCTGEEEYLSNCSNSGWGIHNCGNLEGVALDCLPYADTELLLRDIEYSNNDIIARIQIRYDNSWYNLCPFQVSNAFANQLCLRFNYEDVLNVSMAVELDRPTEGSNETVSLVGCSVDYVNLTECLESIDCPTDKVLGIKCRSLENQTRIITINGFSGVIEINHAGIWRGICDDGWDQDDATVACRELGFEGAIRALKGLVRDTSSFWLTNVDCEGYERHLDHCVFPSWEVTNCYRNEYSGVVCTPHNCSYLPTVTNGQFIGNTTHGSIIELKCDSNYVVTGTVSLECVNSKWIGEIPTCQPPQEFALRLVDFERGDFHMGHVQIYHSDKWGYICDTNWDDTDGAVACTQLGFEGFQQITLQSYHSNASGMFWTNNVACHEGDRSFAECGITFHDSLSCIGNIAGVKCVNLEGHVELINGTTNSSGWLRIYKQGRHYPVCSSTFGPDEVSVACRQLGYPRGKKTDSGPPGATHSELTIDCIGTENSIRDCTEFELEGSNCYRYETYISCYHEDEYTIRLVEGEFGNEGQLEIYLESGWSAVCVSGADKDTLSGICYALGWGYGVRNSSDDTASSQLGVQVQITHCPNDPRNISLCTLKVDNINCTREQALNIVCRTPPENTLRRGHNNALEIFHDNKWGYICDDLFGMSDATVACRHLGHPSAVSFQTRIDVLSDFFWLDNLSCNGFEYSLVDCVSNDFMFENCYASEGVSVECNADYDGFIRFEGDIPQIYLDDGFNYICADGNTFSIHSGRVICRQEGLVDVESVSYTNLGFGFISRFIDCIGNETNVTQCSYQDAPSCVNVSTVKCINPTGLIRIVQGTDTSGIIQIHNGTNWLYICPDRWSYNDARIACNQLGFNTVRDVSQTTDVIGDVVYYGSSFDCYGIETRLIECLHIKTEECGEVGVATLQCEDLTCPPYAEINSCGSSCSPVCYDNGPFACEDCEVKCECYNDFIWEARPHEKCIHKSACPNYCTGNESYTCVAACQRNCDNYKQPLSPICQTLSCTVGCGCQSGYVRRHGIAGECVLEADCEPRTTQSTITHYATPTVTLPSTNATTATATPLSCPDNSQYTDCGTACPLNCSSVPSLVCIQLCVEGCECNEGFVWLQGVCIEKNSCPETGTVDIQGDTVQSGAVSGPLRLFADGKWYNICSDGIDTISNELHEFSCEHLDYASTADKLYSTRTTAGQQTVQLECQTGALAVTQCNYTETDTCDSILNLACTETAVAIPLAAIGGGVGVVLIIALVLLILIILAVVAVMLIRKKNQTRSYKQFNARLSVVSDAQDPVDDPTGIANPIYQTKDLEAEQLIIEDDDVLSN